MDLNRLAAKSNNAKLAYHLIENIQLYFVERLNSISHNVGNNQDFIPIEWFRNSGTNGGGVRFVSQDESIFNRAQVNFSQVQYELDSSKSLNSATAISTIIHPFNPQAPSMHMHISYTELKNEHSYWRIMADLNPAIFYKEDAIVFKNNLKTSSNNYFNEGYQQGSKYFYIPVLECHRGVEHFYLEGFSSGDFNVDSKFAKKIGESVIDTYITIINNRINNDFSATDKEVQLAYHTLYLFQVLTLDRGTTSGLLIHNENDVGILGSIPSHIDTELLRSWVSKMPIPQDKLLNAICNTLGNGVVIIDDLMKQKLCEVSRRHYQAYPEALTMQASGNQIPPTVNNHR
ncbi:MAG: coproporphyrinogen III oxidase [Gammaproteobacteria bacterium]|nr:coproporphyrinogen III oxidase [Gammaproteobacteria bacterium]